LTREPLSPVLDPKTIEVYLLAHGWEDTRRTEMFSAWRKPNRARPTHLFVPLSTAPADYEERLQEVVASLSAVEDRDVETVVTNLRYASADLIRVGLVSPRVGRGELPIDDGRRLFEGAREMMWSAACATVRPRPTFGPRAPSEAKNYLDGVRLGQTESGSYIVTVISEVAPNEQRALVPDEAAHFDVPFERRVTNRLLEALNASRSAAGRVVADQADIEETFQGVVDRGVSANLCAAIARMGAEQVAPEVRIRLDWAASWPPTTDDVPSVSFDASTLPVLQAAESVLRQLGPFEDEQVEGFVERLIRGKEDEIGTIVIDGTARGDRRRIHVDLPDEQYAQAITAHDERLPVRVRGSLEKEGRNWVLREPGTLWLEREVTG
jgi:hypothetical protein